MDTNKPSSQNSNHHSPHGGKEEIYSREHLKSWDDNHPDPSLDVERDPIPGEFVPVELSPDATIDEELLADMNDLNAIELRFQSLIKERLLRETELNPPLFPWETGTEAYLMEEMPEREASNESETVWQPQLAAFNIPFKMPQPILGRLISACSEAVQSINPQGIKLVRAVESLFSVEPLMLHQLANWVLATPQASRSGAGVVLEGDFQTADEQQRIVMSMMAAQKIMEGLAIAVSPTKPTASFRWETTLGAIAIEANYIAESSTSLGKTIQLLIRLPQGGQAIWESAQGSASAARMYPGELYLTLVDCQINGVYPVTISFNQVNQEPLTVAITLNPA
jgi:hypothetical protein